MKKTLAMLLALAMIFSLAACGGKEGSVTNSDKPSNSNSGTTDTGSNGQQGSELVDANNAAAALDLGDAVAAVAMNTQRDVINVGIPADVANFSPWSFSGAGANQALMSLYQPLLHHENGEYYPAIAKSYEMAEDGTSCKFEIFDNIVDSDGNPLTVDDVIFSFTECGKVRPQYAALIPEIEKVDDYNCIFHFSHALELGDFDSFVRIFVVSEKAYNDSPDGMSTTPVGTGPYKMTSYTSGYSMVYEKVENYWQDDLDIMCTRDLANVDTLNFYVISESAQRTMALQDHSIDICMTVSDEDLANFDGQNGYEIAKIESNETMTLFPNCDTSSPCSDLNLRLAICYAISNEAILQGVYNGNGVVCHELTPNYAGGYNIEWDSEENYYNYDTAKAKEYLEKSSYKNEELVIICDASETNKLAAQLVQQFLKQININTTIEAYEATVFEQYIQDASKWDIMVDQTQYNIFYVEGIFGNYDNTRYASGGGMNFVYDDELQSILHTCMDLSTYTEENINKLHEHIIENCYVMGMATGIDQFVVTEDMNGFTLNYRGFLLPGACTYS